MPSIRNLNSSLFSAAPGAHSFRLSDTAEPFFIAARLAVTQAGLTLGLFGGTSRNSEVATRCDPHVLVVGDPGLGKSQVLRAALAACCMCQLIFVGGCCYGHGRMFRISHLVFAWDEICSE